MPDSYPTNNFLLLPPSSFIIIGLMIWAIRSISTSQVEEDENPLKAHTFKPLVAKRRRLMAELTSLFVRTVFIENIALSLFLGMCTFLQFQSK